MPFQSPNLNALTQGPQPKQQNPLALLMALRQHPGFGQLDPNQQLPGKGTPSGPFGQDNLAPSGPPGAGQAGMSAGPTMPPTGPRMDGAGQSSPNAPIPGLPQPAMQQSRGTSVGVPDGNPMTSRSSTGMPDPGNPPGTDGSSAKVLFGFGDDLTTPQLQAIQAALTNSLMTAQQNSEKFQTSRKKTIDGLPAGDGVLYRGGRTNTSAVPNPTPNVQGETSWGGPSSR